MRVKMQGYLVLGLLVFTVFFGFMAAQYVIEHNARLQAESLNQVFRNALEGYLRTHGKVNSAYICKERK